MIIKTFGSPSNVSKVEVMAARVGASVFISLARHFRDGYTFLHNDISSTNRPSLVKSNIENSLNLKLTERCYARCQSIVINPLGSFNTEIWLVPENETEIGLFGNTYCAFYKTDEALRMFYLPTSFISGPVVSTFEESDK